MIDENGDNHCDCCKRYIVEDNQYCKECADYIYWNLMKEKDDTL